MRYSPPVIRLLSNRMRRGSAVAVVESLLLWPAQRACRHAARDRASGHPESEVWLAGGDAQAPSEEAEAILAALRRSGQMGLDALVGEAAEALYRSELARGGANADLGLFGRLVFEPAIRSAIEAGCGRLWDIGAPVPPAGAAREGSER